MAQNKSSAVMQQRSEPHDSLDDFPTPPWAVRGFMEHVMIPYRIERNLLKNYTRIWEPTCNRGYMARPLREYCTSLYATDIHDYGWSGQDDVLDFLWPHDKKKNNANMLVCNPPFKLAEKFIKVGLEIENIHTVAVLVRTSFIEGIKRYNNLFEDCPPDLMAQYVERVPMVKGRYDPKISSATSYCWLVWAKRVRFKKYNPSLVWIPPCKEQLFKETDINVD